MGPDVEKYKIPPPDKDEIDLIANAVASETMDAITRTSQPVTKAFITQEQSTVITMFLTFMQNKGIWPCELEGEMPEAISTEDLFKLRDEFIGMIK